MTPSRHTTIACVLLVCTLFANRLTFAQEAADLRHTRSVNADAILMFSDKATRVEVTAGKYLPSAPATFGDIAYLSTTKNAVVAISNSKIEKEFQIGGELSCSPFVTDTKLLVGSTSKFIAAFDRALGKLLWKFKTKKSVKYTPIEVKGITLAGSDEGKLYAIDSIGKLKWSFDAKAPVTSPSYDSGIVYIGTEAGTCFAINATNGKQIWKADVAGRIPCVSDSFIYCENRNGALVALSKRTGEERWRFDAEATASAFEIALSSAGLAYASNDMMVILDPESGKKLWDMHLKQPLCGAPFIVGTAVYVPCSDWNLYAFDLSTGMELAHTDIGFAPWGTPSYGNGKIYFPNKETLYVILSPEN